MGPIQVGQKYKTRAGQEVTIQSRSDYERVDGYGSTYTVKHSNQLRGSTFCSTVFGDGPLAGRADILTRDRPEDLVELLSPSEFEPVQLSLFD